MRSPLLSGLALEPDEIVADQVAAWDNADLALTILQALKRSGGRLMPNHLRELANSFTERIACAVNFQSDGAAVFTEPLDPQLMKLCRLLDHAGAAIDDVPGPALLRRAVEKLERHIVSHLVATSGSGFRWWGQPPAKPFRGSTIDEASRYILLKAFDGTEQQVLDLGEAEKRRVAEQIIEAIDHLDPAAQEAIRQRLGVDNLDAASVLAPGAIAALGGVGAMASLGGFASYSLLTSTMAATAGAIGVTLPFSAYIMATSTLAFLANPVTIAATVLGGGWLLRKRVNRTMHDRMAPLLTAIAFVAQDRDPPGKAAEERFVAHAARRYRQFIFAAPSERRAFERAFPAFRRPPG